MRAICLQPPRVASLACMEQLGLQPLVLQGWEELNEDYALFADLPYDGGTREWVAFLRLLASPRCRGVYRTGAVAQDFVTLEYLLWQSGYPTCCVTDETVFRNETVAPASSHRWEPLICQSKQRHIAAAVGYAHDLVESETAAHSPHALSTIVADVSGWQSKFDLMPLARIAVVDSVTDEIPQADGHVLISPSSIHRLPESARNVLVCPPFLPVIEELHFGPPLADRDEYALLLDPRLLRADTFEMLWTEMAGDFRILDARDAGRHPKDWWPFRSVCMPADESVHSCQWTDIVREIAASGTPLIILNLPHLTYLPFAAAAATSVPTGMLRTSIPALVEEFDRTATYGEERKLLMNALHTNATVLMNSFIRRIVDGA